MISEYDILRHTQRGIYMQYAIDDAMLWAEEAAWQHRMGISMVKDVTDSINNALEYHGGLESYQIY